MTSGRRVLGFVAVVAVIGSVFAVAPGVGAAVPTAARTPRDPGSSPAYDATLAHYATQPVDWVACNDDGTTPDLQCAKIATPLDWAHPNKGDLALTITRTLATGTRRGIIQTNPGGPGQAGFFMPQYLHDVEPDLAAHYDLVSMDPRGVATSTTIECQGTVGLDKLYALDGRDHSTANTLKFLKYSKQEADGCATDPITPYINTDQTVRDLDLVRAIFGDTKMSYVGYSAGTWMGSWYATLFPSHVDRFVLDGNFDWTNSWYNGFRVQPQGFQRRFEEDLLPWLAKYDNLLHLGKTAAKVRNTYEARRAALAKHPLTLVDGSSLDGNLYDNDIVGYLYQAQLFPDLGNAMSILERYATATPAEQQFVTDAFASFPVDQSDHVFWSIVCNDTTASPQQLLFSDWQTFGAKYPLTGASWLANPCPYWKFPAIGSPVTGKGIPPLLMIQNDGDPATPYSGGLQAHRNTPGSVLLTVRHEGDHTIYGGVDQCVDNIANDWLVRGILPKKDVSCEGVPLPDLAANAPVAARSASAGTSVALRTRRESGLAFSH